MGHRLVTEPLFTYTPPMRGQLAMATDTEDEMKAKHTPGPWYTASTGNHQALVISEHNGANVAVAYNGEPDARLIAAAPDLLDALSTMLAVVKWNGLINQESPDAMTLYAAIGQAEDAIAKAEAQS